MEEAYRVTIEDKYNDNGVTVSVTTGDVIAKAVLKAACAAMLGQGFSSGTIENAIEVLYEEGIY